MNKNPEYRTYAETIKTAEHKKANGGYHKPCAVALAAGVVRRKIEIMEENKRNNGEYLL